MKANEEVREVRVVEEVSGCVARATQHGRRPLFGDYGVSAAFESEERMLMVPVYETNWLRNLVVRTPSGRPRSRVRVHDTTYRNLWSSFPSSKALHTVRRKLHAGDAAQMTMRVRNPARRTNPNDLRTRILHLRGSRILVDTQHECPNFRQRKLQNNCRCSHLAKVLVRVLCVYHTCGSRAGSYAVLLTP